MVIPDVQAQIDEAVSRGEYPDRKAAAAGLLKQLIDRQQGMLKNVKGDPVATVEKVRSERWASLLQQAGGSGDDDDEKEEKALRLYVEELKKLLGV